MKLLLDTNVFLWSDAAPRRLRSARALIESGENDVLVSSVVAWEIAIKHAVGRLPLPEAPAAYVPATTRRLGGTPVPISHEHALGVAVLPPHHRDPFDRMLIAQAIDLGATLVTGDERLAQYDVEMVVV